MKCEYNKMKNKYEDEEDLLLARIEDKVQICYSKNKITYSDFLNEKEQMIVNKKVKIDNSFWFGGNENFDRKALIIYPKKISKEIAKTMLKTIFSVIRIELPDEHLGEYEHRNYLSALIKIGIDRSKIGDIIVSKNGADIVIFKLNEVYILEGLKQLTRFKKSNISIVDIAEVKNKIDSFEERTIIVPSLRCDNIVSEIARCSRKSANDIIESERVLVNYEIVLKPSRKILIGDKITIRGKGKFIIDENLGNTKKDNIVLKIKKYV